MDCNLDLRLAQPPASTTGEIPPEKQLTIFYNGRICVCDVTEIQARAIIWQASKQMEQGRYNDSLTMLSSELPISPVSQLCSTSSGSSSSSEMSMKKSLQRFLQKRKDRQLVTSPYGNTIRRD